MRVRTDGKNYAGRVLPQRAPCEHVCGQRRRGMGGAGRGRPRLRCSRLRRLATCLPPSTLTGLEFTDDQC